MDTEIVLKDLSKCYGKKQALHHVNLTIPQGMFGLLGPNGAGKTTLMKIISTLLPKTSGEVKVCGVDIEQKKEIRGMIGYLPQDFSMYGNMTAYEAMDYLGVLSDMKKQERKERIPFLLEKVNLSDDYRTKVKAMSGGMRRRLGIAQAILHDPKVLIVDEPTAGLDPEERVRFRNLLCEIAEDRIVILSTHIVGDIEAACEGIAIIDEGRVIYNGTVDGLLQTAKGRVFTMAASKKELPRLKKELLVTSMHTQGGQAWIRFAADAPRPGAKACEPNMEDAYMLYLHDKGAKSPLSQEGAGGEG